MSKKYGGIYEIILSNNRYLYVCLVKHWGFCVFDIYSETPLTDIETILSKKIKLYAVCKETAINKKIWKKIGNIDIEKYNISFPPLLAIYASWQKEYCFEMARAMNSDGNTIKITIGEFSRLVNNGLIYNFFPNHQSFEKWLELFFEDYPSIIMDDDAMTKRIQAQA